MLKRRRRACPFKKRREIRIIGRCDGIGEKFDGHVAIEKLIASAIDDAHAALADLSQESDRAERGGNDDVDLLMRLGAGAGEGDGGLVGLHGYAAELG